MNSYRVHQFCLQFKQKNLTVHKNYDKLSENYKLIKKLHELEEIEFKNLFIDGTRIESNANKYNSNSCARYSVDISKELFLWKHF